MVIVFAVILPIVLLSDIYLVLGRSNIELDTDSEYGRILIYRTMVNDREERHLVIDKGFESGMFIDSPNELVYEYTKYYDLMNYFNQNIDNTLLIGGAAYSYPKHFLNTYPEKKMDVVEIDKKVTAIAREYFHLEDNSNLTIYHEDGRTYLNRTNNKYDAILNDAFNGASPPFHLLTKEANERIYHRLSDDGIYLVNIISSLEGSSSNLLKSQVNTIKEVFPTIYIFATRGTLDLYDIQNLMIVATKEETRRNIDLTQNEYIDNMLENYYEIGSYENSVIFTDDYAPIDYYLKDILYN